MKKLTIFKLILTIVGWLVSAQLMPLGLNLMSKPSDVAPVLGFLVLITTIGSMFYCSFYTGSFIARLIKEHRGSTNIKK